MICFDLSLSMFVFALFMVKFHSFFRFADHTSLYAFHTPYMYSHVVTMHHSYHAIMLSCPIPATTHLRSASELAMPRPQNPISCPEDHQLHASIVARHWPLNTYAWNVQCCSQVVMSTTQLLIDNPLWDNPRGLHNRVSERCWILLSDMNGHISSTTLYSNQSPTDEILNLN